MKHKPGSHRLRDVFNAGGMPSITYVSRESVRLEEALRGALDRGHAIITVSGPTKSGKTVLCRTVIGRKESVWIQGGQVSSIESFWELLAAELKMEILTDIAAEKSSSSSDLTCFGAEGGVPGLAKAKGTQTFGGGQSEKSSRTLKLSQELRSATIIKAIEERKVIIIDDFHFIESAIQKSIVNSLKSAIFDGLDVVVIAVPHRAFDPLSVQQEMQGRFIHIEVPKWDEDELKMIPDRGFPALNVQIEDRLRDEICRESRGSPLLVQDLCFRLCRAADISNTQLTHTFLVGDAFPYICTQVAENSGFPVFERLARGPQSRKDRKPRKLKDGGTVDTYQAVIVGFLRDWRERTDHVCGTASRHARFIGTGRIAAEERGCCSMQAYGENC